MVRLGDVAQGRDNNFNLIRMGAAMAVLVSHAWPLSLGRGTVEPLQIATGYSLGTLAVYVFFAISGFFITASFDRAPSRGVFVMARVRRLFPALIVSILLATLVMGPMVTSLSAGQYLTSFGTWEFILRNSALVSLKFTLPGVFETNPYPTVEGSIWTLPNEVACYLAVFLAGVLGLIRRRGALTAALAVYAGLWMFAEVTGAALPARIEALRVLSLPFAIGMAMYLWRDRVLLSGWAAAGLVGLTVAARHTLAYEPLLALMLAYCTFWLAYLPAGALRRYNKLGDYSYGTYLYAFPAQGLMVWLWGPMGPGTNIALALPVTVALAVLSWHLVEKPALHWRRRRQSNRTTAANSEHHSTGS